jgi:hypothetical protein
MPKAAEEATAGEIAGAAVATWGRMGEALSPVIGHAGFAALLKRSLFLARAGHPCLTAVFEASPEPGNFDVLRATLSQQPQVAAAAAQEALVKTFHDLLINLIGGSLTERLLCSVWNDPTSGDAVQDISS